MLATLLATNAAGAARDLKQGGVAVAAVLIDEFVDDDARVGAQAESRLVVEGDAERRVRAGLQRVALEDRIVDLQRDGRGRFCTRDRGAALQCRDLAHLTVGSLIRLRLILRARRKRPKKRRERASGRRAAEERYEFATLHAAPHPGPLPGGEREKDTPTC